MAKQMTVLTDRDKTIGWLTWWTLRKGEYNLRDVQESAAALDVDGYIQNRLDGRSRESAWKRATQLGATGRSLSTMRTGAVARRLVTRNAIPGDSSVRCLVVEETNPTRIAFNDVEEWVTAYTVAVLELRGQDFSVEWSNAATHDPSYTEIDSIVSGMEDEMHRIEGRIDDGRIRAAVLGWLERQHRVTVRGAGGVYYLPCASTWLSKEEMEGKLLAIREWLNTIDSPFSVVAMTKAGAHSMEDFVVDAVAEVKAELQVIDDKIRKWEANANMNDGSQNYSANTQLEKLEQLDEKVSALKEALGEEIGVVDEMTALVKARAQAMVKNSASRIRKAGIARKKAKSDKKAGTAAARKRKKAL